jgi:hypothetical protein
MLGSGAYHVTPFRHRSRALSLTHCGWDFVGATW